LSQRTKEALAAHKRAGFPLGRSKGIRKSKLDQYRSEIEAFLQNGATQKFIAHRYGTTEANLSRWMAKHQLEKVRTEKVKRGGKL
jgi:DNA invertase Pin-like site-specific DNA recombinase